MALIGIDLTALPPQQGGVAFYLTGLVRALQHLDRENEYRLIARDEQGDDLRPLAPNFSLVQVSLSSRPARLVWEQAALPGLARRLGLDVLHSPHYTRPLRQLTCASVVGVMDLTVFTVPRHHTMSKRAFFRAMMPACVRRADRLIAISESTKRDLQRWLQVDPARIDVTPLAVSPAYRSDQPASAVTDVRRRYRLPESYLLYVGRLEPRKNLPRLLEAYQGLVGRMSSAPALVLAGAQGWHGRELSAALERLRARVHAIGYVPEADLPALYAGAMVFVYPSLYEGFGIPVLEALACGVPTITSNLSSTAEVAGDAADLVDPASTGDLLAALERLLRDPQRRQELRQRGLERARAFSWDNTARLTRQSYIEAIRQGPAAR